MPNNAAQPLQKQPCQTDSTAEGEHMPRYTGMASEKSSLQRAGVVLVVACLLLLVFLLLIAAAVPPVSRDALTHHLAVPKLWIEHGGMVDMPALVFSYYPMNLDLLYVIPLLFGNDILPKYLHFIFALATAWMIYNFLKSRSTLLIALSGALLFLSIPIISKLSISVYVDLGLIFFSWASIVFLCKWSRDPQSVKYLVCSAVFCGLGLGTKYNGLIVLVLLTLFIPIIYVRSVRPHLRQVKKMIGYPLVFAAVSLTLFSPWMVRNFLLTKNPIYPLYSSWQQEHGERETITNVSMKPWLQRKLIYRESALATALIPLRIFFQGQDDNPRLFDGQLNPILVLFPLFLLFRRNAYDASMRREHLLLASFSILFLLYASFMVDMRIRYISAVIPPLVVLTMLGIQNAFGWMDTIGKRLLRTTCRLLLTTVIVFFFTLNATYAVALFHAVDPLPFLTGDVSRDEYLNKHLPDYPAIRFVNQVPTDGKQIFALFLGNRLYYFDSPVTFGNQKFVSMVEDAMAGRRLSRQLIENGYSHCMIGIHHFQAWVSRMFDEPRQALVSQWLREDCELLFSQNGYAVLKLVGTDEKRPAP